MSEKWGINPRDWVVWKIMERKNSGISTKCPEKSRYDLKGSLVEEKRMVQMWEKSQGTGGKRK